MQNVSFNVTSSREFSVACPAIFNAEKRKSATATLRRKRCAILRIFLLDMIVKTTKRLPRNAAERVVNSTIVKIGLRLVLKDKRDKKLSGGGGARHGTFPGTLEQLAVAVKARFDDIVQ